MKNELLILVADDDEDDRLLIGEAFEEVTADVKVHFTRDGVDLLEHLNRLEERHTRPLILLDLNMPRMGGLEVLRRLRQDPEHRLTPIVVLSTSSSPDDVKQVYELGANTFFSKPLSFDHLVDTARMLCQYWGQWAKVPSPGPRGLLQ